MTKTLNVELPWPDRALSPNSRTHWRAKHAAFQDARNEAFSLVINGRIFAVNVQGDIAVTITWKPPSKRRHDADNVLASLKAALDGIALALGVDDQCFNPITIRRADPIPGGGVHITVKGQGAGR